MEGWIKLHRQLLEKAIWQSSSPEQKTILITLLIMANHKENEWAWNGEKFKVKEGQFITSLDSIKYNCGKGITIQNIRTALKKFEKYEFLKNEATKTGRLITINNWNIYQSEQQNEQQVNNKRTTSEQQVNTNKNVNNINNANNVKKIKEKEKSVVGQSVNIDESINFYNKNIGMITNYVAEEIESFIQDGIEEALVIKAMKKALDAGKGNWGYTKGILNNCYKENIKTVEEFDAKEMQKNNNKVVKIEKSNFYEGEIEEFRVKF